MTESYFKLEVILLGKKSVVIAFQHRELVKTSRASSDKAHL